MEKRLAFRSLRLAGYALAVAVAACASDQIVVPGAQSEVPSNVTQPAVVTAVSPAIVAVSEPVTFSWHGSAVTACSGSWPDANSVGVAGSYSFQPSETVSLSVRCTGVGGTVTDGKTVTVTPATQAAPTRMSSGWYYPNGSGNTCGYLGWLGYNPGHGYHLARDMCNDAGSPVYSVGAGTIVESSSTVGGYGPGFTQGGAVVAQYRAGDGTCFTVLYGHLNSPKAKGTVAAGDIVGVSNAWSPPHVHVGIRVGCTPIANPWMGYTTDINELNDFVEPLAFLQSHGSATQTGAIALALTVSPATTQTLASTGGSIPWSLTVTDQNGAPVSNASVLVTDNATAQSGVVTTNSSGTGTWNSIVPSGKAAGNYLVNFQATKSGATTSIGVSRSVTIQAAPVATTLVLNVSPATTQTLASTGGSIPWSLTVTDQNGAPVSNASVLVTDNASAQSGVVTTNSSGTGTWTSAVPSGKAAGNHLVNFQATLSGATASSGVSRSVMIQTAPVTTTLVLNVSPATTQTLASTGGSIPWSLTVTDQNGAPVSNASVLVTDNATAQSGVVTTNSSGTGTWTSAVPSGKAAGNYLVNFQATLSGATASSGVSRSVTIQAAPVATTLVLNVSPATTQTLASTGGSIPWSLTVTDQNGAPVSNASVLVTDNASAQSGVVTTNSSGTGTWTSAVPSGKAAGNYLVNFQATLSGATASSGVSRSVMIQTAPVMTTLVLNVSPATTQTLASTGGSIPWSLTVTDQNGAPVSNASVLVTDNATAQSGVVTTNSNGTGTWNSVVPSGKAAGNYLVNFQATLSGATASSGVSRSVTIQAAPVATTLVLNVSPATTQTLASTGGSIPWSLTVTDQNGAPVSNASVLVTDNASAQSGVVTTNSSGTGTWTSAVPSGKAAGNYLVNFQATLSGATASSGVSRSVTIQAAPVATTLVLNVSPATTQTLASTGGSIPWSLTVSDQNGAPVSNASVLVTDNATAQSGVVTTNSNGTGTWNSVVPGGKAAGNYLVNFQATKSGATTSSGVSRSVTIQAAPVATTLVLNVSPATTQTLASTGGSIPWSLTVTDQNGAPVSNASVLVTDNATAQSGVVTTNNNGTGTWNSVVPGGKAAGNYLVNFQATKSGATTSIGVSRSVTIQAAPVATTLVLNVSPATTQTLASTGGSIPWSLTVTDQNGAAVGNASVLVTDNATAQSGVVTTNSSGTGTWTSVVPNGKAAGNYLVNFQATKSGATASSGVSRSVTVQAPTIAIPPMPSGTNQGTTGAPGPTTSTSTVGMSWNPSTGATYYDFGIRDILSNLLVVSQSVAGTSYTATLTPGRQYRWNVAACSSAGCSAFTQALYFQTPSSVIIPAAPASTSPGTVSSPGPTLGSRTVTLTWSASAGATSYGVGVRDIATNDLVVSTTVTGTSYTVTLSAGKTYRWNLAACSTAGCSSYTTPLYFKTP